MKTMNISSAIFNLIKTALGSRIKTIFDKETIKGHMGIIRTIDGQEYLVQVVKIEEVQKNKPRHCVPVWGVG